ncbi:MAG TPA: hypothetical protein VG056_17130 [Pirellulales bacterium]|nr:hypothetical protein [Pirellulales bacterium]
MRRSDRLTSGELATLLLAGALATVAVVAFSPALRIPGHAILRATLPIVCGMALVPRRFAGSIMTVGAGAAAWGLSASGFENWQPAAVVALLALGPAIDVAMMGRAATGWRLYARFALAGILANSLSFAVRFGTFWFRLDDGRPHSLRQFSVGVFLSFAACGAVAGLLSAAVCCRSSVNAK